MPPPSDAPSQQPKSGVPGWARWAIGCGVRVLCCCPVGGGILFPVMIQTRQAANSAESMSQLKRLSLAWNLYLADSEDRSCPLPEWHNHLRKYVGGDDSKAFLDPLLTKSSGQLGYGMNPKVALQNVASFEDPSKVVILALTTTPGKDAQVTKETLRKASQGPFRTIWATADGAVKKALIDEAQRLQWKPVLMKK